MPGHGTTRAVPGMAQTVPCQVQPAPHAVPGMAQTVPCQVQPARHIHHVGGPPEHSPPPSPYISMRSTHHFQDPIVRYLAVPRVTTPLSFAPMRYIAAATARATLLRRTLAAIDHDQCPDGTLRTPSSYPYSCQLIPLTATPLRHRAQQLLCHQRSLRCCPRRPRCHHRLHRCGRSPSLHHRRRLVSASTSSSSTFAACCTELGLRNDSTTPPITSGGHELSAWERRRVRKRGETKGGEAGAGGEMEPSGAEGLVGVGSGVGQ